MISQPSHSTHRVSEAKWIPCLISVTSRRRHETSHRTYTHTAYSRRKNNPHNQATLCNSEHIPSTTYKVECEVWGSGLQAKHRVSSAVRWELYLSSSNYNPMRLHLPLQLRAPARIFPQQKPDLSEARAKQEKSPASISWSSFSPPLAWLMVRLRSPQVVHGLQFTNETFYLSVLSASNLKPWSFPHWCDLFLELLDL